MSIPINSQYAWMLKLKGPRHMLKAIELYGVREIVGKQHNPTIMGWAREVGVDLIYKEDEIPWCGLATAVVLKRAERPNPLTGWDMLRALKYTLWGVPVKKSDAAYGDLLIFSRSGGGHVGWYVGEDDECYHVLGGNQGNMYNIIRIEKTRLHAVRRAPYTNQPAEVKKYRLKATGGVSKDES